MNSDDESKKVMLFAEETGSEFLEILNLKMNYLEKQSNFSVAIKTMLNVTAILFSKVLALAIYSSREEDKERLKNFCLEHIKDLMNQELDAILKHVEEQEKANDK